jgi:hypothetical protein
VSEPIEDPKPEPHRIDPISGKKALIMLALAVIFFAAAFAGMIYVANQQAQNIQQENKLR